jgi:hypothetical protein
MVYFPPLLKSEAFHYSQAITYFECQIVVCNVRPDRGGEYINVDMESYHAWAGIHQQLNKYKHAAAERRRRKQEPHLAE